MGKATKTNTAASKRSLASKATVRSKPPKRTTTKSRGPRSKASVGKKCVVCAKMIKPGDELYRDRCMHQSCGCGFRRFENNLAFDDEIAKSWEAMRRADPERAKALKKSSQGPRAHRSEKGKHFTGTLCEGQALSQILI